MTGPSCLLSLAAFVAAMMAGALAAPERDVLIEGRVRGPHKAIDTLGKSKISEMCSQLESQGKFKCKRTWGTGAMGQLLNGNERDWLPEDLKRVGTNMKLQNAHQVSWTVADDEDLPNNNGEKMRPERAPKARMSWFSVEKPVELFTKGRDNHRRPVKRRLADGASSPDMMVQHNAPLALGALSSYAGKSCTSRCNDPDRFLYLTTGAGVTIYVVDGKVADHEQFKDMYSGSSRITERYYSGSAQANVGNSCASEHGTHVAALAAGFEYGAAKSAEIVSVAVQPGCSQSGKASELAEGLNWILARHLSLPSPRPRAVVSMSLLASGASAHGRIIGSIVEDLIEAGIVVVAAAGNFHRESCEYVPAGLPGVITVAAAIVEAESPMSYPWSFSNYGSCVDVWAPGVNIVSAAPDCYDCTAVYSGTSQAAPLVSGLVAQILEQQPELTPSQVKQELQFNAASNYLELLGPTYSNTINLFAQTDLSLETSVQLS